MVDIKTVAETSFFIHNERHRERHKIAYERKNELMLRSKIERKIRKKSKMMIMTWLIVCMSLTGCTNIEKNVIDTKIVLTIGFSKDEIFRIEKASCVVPEMMVYLMNTKNEYEETFGKQIWSVTSEGETLEENIKETVLARLARIKAMNLLAAQKQVTLSQEELEQVSQAAKMYMESLGEEQAKLLGVDLELIEQMYAEYALSDKLYQYLIADINLEISDDEARTITVEQIFIKTYSVDEKGEKIPYTQQGKVSAYERAKAVLKLVNEGEDFKKLAAEYSDDATITYSFGKGVYEPAFETAAFNLATDEISDIVETEKGYHIIKCISTFDRNQTDRNKIKIIEKRRQEVFNAEYSKFVDGLTRNINDKLWNEITFLEDEKITTSDFYEIYQQQVQIQD